MENDGKVERVTLKELWRKHREKSSPFQPSKEVAGKCGSAFTLFWTLTLSSTVLLYVLPQLYRDDPTMHLIWNIVSVFITLQILINWAIVVFNRADWWGKTQSMLFSPRPDDSHLWRQCLTCQCAVPPRSWHCEECKTCVLKRDHHCYFTNTCIGFYNQKNFILMIFYFAVGLFLGGWFIFNLVRDTVPFFSLETCWSYFPLISIGRWIAGSIPLSLALLLSMFFCNIALGIISTGFFCWQTLITCYGQTGWDARRRSWKYSVSFWYNIRTVFGPRPFLLFLVPISALSPQVGDGVYFKAGSSMKPR